MDRPPLIDHDPDEPPRDTSKSPWGVLMIGLVFVWAVTFAYETVDWRSVMLGAFTAGVFVSWAVDVTGNKVPTWWRR